MKNKETECFIIATQSSRAQPGSWAKTHSRDAYVNVQVDGENLEINWGLFFSLYCPENWLQVGGVDTQPFVMAWYSKKREIQGNGAFWENTVFSLFCFLPSLALLPIAPYRGLSYL